MHRNWARSQPINTATEANTIKYDPYIARNTVGFYITNFENLTVICIMQITRRILSLEIVMYLFTRYRVYIVICKFICKKYFTHSAT